MYPLSQHPLAPAQRSRLDIFFARHQHEVMQDAMRLMHQALPELEDKSQILVINSLCEHESLVRSVTELCRGNRSSITVYSAGGTVLRNKLEMLGKLIPAKNIKMIIVNSWEFATNGSRQKHTLANWLREMRDAFKLRVVIYSSERSTPKFGALASLSFAAASLDEAGGWQWHNKYINGEFYDTATEAAERYAYELAKSREIKTQQQAEQKTEPQTEQGSTNVDEAQPTKKTAGMTIPRREWHGALNFRSIQDIVGSLKNKDLTPASAEATNVIRADATISVEAETNVEQYDYAMAA